MIYKTKVIHPIEGLSVHIIKADNKKEMLRKLYHSLEDNGYRYDEYSIKSIKERSE